MVPPKASYHFHFVVVLLAVFLEFQSFQFPALALLAVVLVVVRGDAPVAGRRAGRVQGDGGRVGVKFVGQSVPANLVMGISFVAADGSVRLRSTVVVVGKGRVGLVDLHAGSPELVVFLDLGLVPFEGAILFLLLEFSFALFVGFVFVVSVVQLFVHGGTGFEGGLDRFLAAFWFPRSTAAAVVVVGWKGDPCRVNGQRFCLAIIIVRVVGCGFRIHGLGW